MANRRIALASATPQPDRAGFRQSTRAELLEAAGHVFAEKGFDRATGKEICPNGPAPMPPPSTTISAGIDGLYAAVLEEANRRLVPVEALSAAIAGKTGARATRCRRSSYS